MTLSSMTLPRRPRPVAFVASVLIAWLLLALIALGLRRGPIESDLAARATQAVRQEVTSSAEVTFDGRDALVNGTFASAQDAEAARRVAASVPGAASARLGDDVTIAAAQPRPLVIAVKDGALVVSATVPDQHAREELLGAAVSASSGGLTGDVTVEPEVVGPPVDALARLAESITSVPGDHEVSVAGTTVVLSGTVPDEADVEQLGTSVLAAAGQVVPGATLDNRLTVQPVPADAAAAPPDAAAAEPSLGAEAVRERLEAVLDGSSVTFARGSAALAAPVGALLDEVAAVLATGDVVVQVGGYADANGPAALNERLSWQRAQAVVDHLVAAGVPADSLRAAGFGSARPVAPNDTVAGRAANRRVEFVPLP
jgi:outer membrane protein OmpA-like peptidoglycan-associated protein